jgi:rhamnose transport system substrate-binding protein
MSTFRVPRALLLVLAVLCLGLALGACGETQDDEPSDESSAAQSSEGEANPEGEIKEGLSIVSMPKQLGNPYEEIEHGGVAKAAEEIGAEHRIVGPTDAGASSQVPLIQSTMQQEPDAFVIAGNDPNAVAPALKQMSDRGIAVGSMDSDVAADARAFFVNQASTEEIGVAQIEMASEQIGGKGQIAILSATANAPNQNAWIEVMEAELKKPEYSDIELVEVAYGDDDDQKSFQETQGLLQAYPDLDAIIAPTTVGIAAAGRYICGSRYEDQVKVTGLGTPNQMRKFVNSGCVEEFALWSPEDVGYLAGYAAASLASGIITGAEGETFEAGELGEYEIGADGEIVLGPPTRFNKENIGEFDF